MRNLNILLKVFTLQNSESQFFELMSSVTQLALFVLMQNYNQFWVPKLDSIETNFRIVICQFSEIKPPFPWSISLASKLARRAFMVFDFTGDTAAAASSWSLKVV